MLRLHLSNPFMERKKKEKKKKWKRQDGSIQGRINHIIWKKEEGETWICNKWCPLVKLYYKSNTHGNMQGLNWFIT